MKKIGIIISIIIIYFFIYFLQTNFFCWFTINGVQPNLFILLALFIGIFMGRKTGTILGVLFGLYTDFLYSNTIGISGILFGAIGFIGDYLDKKFSKDSKITIVVMGAIITAIYEIIMYVFRFFKLSTTISLVPFLYTLGIEIIYNALIIIILYPLIHKFGVYIEGLFKNKKMLPRYF